MQLIHIIFYFLNERALQILHGISRFLKIHFQFLYRNKKRGLFTSFTFFSGIGKHHELHLRVKAHAIGREH
jgi:hypothetical protein